MDLKGGRVISLEVKQGTETVIKDKDGKVVESATDEEIEKCTASFGDLLVCEGGDIGRAAIWNYPYDIRIQNHIHKLRAYKQLCTKFFFWVFYFYKTTGQIGGKGIGIQGLSSKALDNILIPLPPLKEQQRIVAQIEKLFEQLR